MTAKKKPHTAGIGTASNPTTKSLDSSAQDPLKGWYSLGQNAVKKTRNNRTQSGRNDKGGAQ